MLIGRMAVFTVALQKCVSLESIEVEILNVKTPFTADCTNEVCSVNGRPECVYIGMELSCLFLFGSYFEIIFDGAR